MILDRLFFGGGWGFGAAFLTAEGWQSTAEIVFYLLEILASPSLNGGGGGCEAFF